MELFLKKISIINFKSYSEAEFSFSKEINCFIGNNGVGKTNILDAIHYLSFCKSFLNPIDQQNIKHETPFFVIHGLYEFGKEEEDIYCGLKREQKKQFKRNKKEYTKLSDHIGLLPLIIISPLDSELITGGSEDRRRFMDTIIAQYDNEYLANLIKYNRALSHRNALLKKMSETGSFSKDSLELWDMQLVDYGNKVYKKRREFIEAFLDRFQYYYNFISTNKESVNIVFQSHLNDQLFETCLAQSLKKDRAAEYTTCGVHKDDLIFYINSLQVKRYGSQGQQKSFVVALKLAQFDFIKKIKSVKPIIALDDIHDKLDEHRMNKLMELISENYFGQIFITDTHENRIKKMFKNIDVEFKQFKI